ncbi:MAG TPA: flagellar hook capping FlgD N-terminal domain-containing protein [Novosphingobium sp.]|nr:flagellar hook capping FlgD N-terminal domain-containing protein [Novosphingobium sp.]HQA17798.1 flagellar hook capping FlgD N-terminal domain-containing protein [Novosphingobium sp.]
MTVISATTASAAASSNTASKTLGQADFIRLMTTQMKMQDPLEPVDNKEMIAQMAQFSSLSGIETMNSTLKAIATQLDTLIAAQTSQNAAQE